MDTDPITTETSTATLILEDQDPYGLSAPDWRKQWILTQLPVVWPQPLWDQRR